VLFIVWIWLIANQAFGNLLIIIDVGLYGIDIAFIKESVFL